MESHGSSRQGSLLDADINSNLLRIDFEMDAFRKDYHSMEKNYEELGQSVRSIEKSIRDIASVLNKFDAFDKRLEVLETDFKDRGQNGCLIVKGHETRLKNIEAIITKANTLVWSAVAIAILGLIGLKAL